jgi:hypothetical protein
LLQLAGFRLSQQVRCFALLIDPDGGASVAVVLVVAARPEIGELRGHH